MTCDHDLAEREAACADGMCPLCMAAEIERLTARLDDGPAVTDLLHEAQAEIERLQELLRGVGANRYWDGRWRDEKAENERLQAERAELRRDLEIWRRNGGDDLMRAEIERLQECLSQACRQWKMYAELQEDRDLTTEQSVEGTMYRSSCSHERRVIPGTNIPDAGTPSY